jgi:methyl coenzyme M reductase subunit D
MLFILKVKQKYKFFRLKKKEIQQTKWSIENTGLRFLTNDQNVKILGRLELLNRVLRLIYQGKFLPENLKKEPELLLLVM